MAELQPPEACINGGGGLVGAPSENLGPSLGSKRQRRPSVRLGDIGDQPATLSYDSYLRPAKLWNDFKYRPPSQLHKDPKSSKTRPLTNLSNGEDIHETLEIEDKNTSGDGSLDLLAIGNRKLKDFKAKRGGGGTKRVRSNWVSRVDEDEKFSGGEDGDEGFRDFDPEGSESPLKEHSPIHSLENPNVDLRQNSDRGEGAFIGQRKQSRVRVSESRDHDAVELDGPSDNDARFLEDGVRMWLNGLGLGRYAPVFEIHEVDEEVLPLLTLEDLKDMGINAVGSRRKMYCAIEKLGKGFS
ncbi:Sterile alpha motif domain [Macleaya cordata]|uniref:Sterile alpha motif domain n=1 Tax=Macleaya cordata TaxID=56857 RepID=A0A200R3W2_MACCD|nr:Sterile alpha motif domain [Macleaya cordata]